VQEKIKKLCGEPPTKIAGMHEHSKITAFILIRMKLQVPAVNLALARS
jgi:hypothetical protein